MKPYLYHADSSTAVRRKKPTAHRPPKRLSAGRSRRHADHPNGCLQEEADGAQTTQRLSARRNRQRADHPTAVLNETNEICANHVYIYILLNKPKLSRYLSIIYKIKNRSLTPVLKFVFQKSNKYLQFRGSKFGDALARQYL